MITKYIYLNPSHLNCRVRGIEAAGYREGRVMQSNLLSLWLPN